MDLRRPREAGVEDGRYERAGQARDRSPVAEEVLVAGALTVLHARVKERSRHLSALANPLMSMLVMPYRSNPEATTQRSARARE